MTTEEKVARRKPSLLELASELGNVSRACRIIGYSRQQFYEIRRNYQVYGAQGLVDRPPGPIRTASQPGVRGDRESGLGRRSKTIWSKWDWYQSPASQACWMAWPSSSRSQGLLK